MLCDGDLMMCQDTLPFSLFIFLISLSSFCFVVFSSWFSICSVSHWTSQGILSQVSFFSCCFLHPHIMLLFYFFPSLLQLFAWIPTFPPCWNIAFWRDVCRRVEMIAWCPVKKNLLPVSSLRIISFSCQQWMWQPAALLALLLLPCCFSVSVVKLVSGHSGRMQLYRNYSGIRLFGAHNAKSWAEMTLHKYIGFKIFPSELTWCFYLWTVIGWWPLWLAGRKDAH